MRQPALANGWVQDRDRLAPHLGQDHKVVQVPMQDARQLKLGQLVQRQTERPAGKLQSRSRCHQLAQRHALLATPGRAADRKY